MGVALKILVVDDDTDAIDSLAELLELEGHDVTVAYDGDTAVAAYTEEKFDIAFMDIMMPGKNGVESLTEIRSIQSDARVLMMTGYSIEALIDQALNAGARGVLFKPLKIEEVLAAL